MVFMQSGLRLSQQVGKLLHAHGLLVASAESCSGGLLGHLITAIPGSSDYFLGGVVAYSNQAKQAWLGVQEDTLLRCGAVSRKTVLEMAAGVRQALQAHYPLERIIGISISGVAGPGGGTPQKPVGTVWIGLSAEQGDQAWQHLFNGNRAAVKQHSARQALMHLQDFLLSLKDR